MGTTKYEIIGDYNYINRNYDSVLPKSIEEDNEPIWEILRRLE
ncbi:hypothetical protein [Helcococcus kunzii]|nr:hypothetical protein [Helcococcus kunzii]